MVNFICLVIIAVQLVSRSLLDFSITVFLRNGSILIMYKEQNFVSCTKGYNKNRLYFFISHSNFLTNFFCFANETEFFNVRRQKPIFHLVVFLHWLIAFFPKK